MFRKRRSSKVEFSRTQARTGFTLVEVVMSVVVSGVVIGFAVPKYLTFQQTVRTSGDIRNLTSLVAEAKMRAAANFTHARVYADTSGGRYHVEFWNPSGNGGSGCWQTDGDTTNSCTTSTSPVTQLSSGVSFGYGSIGTPPANTETTIGQAPYCYTGYAGQSTNTSYTANTACIEFNSRGIPSDPAPGGTAGSAGGVPDATMDLYVNDGTRVYGVTVLATGAIQTWFSQNASTPNWQSR